MRPRLSAKQKRLIKELDEIASLLHLNYREIQEYEQESRTTRLEMVRRHFARGEVVLQYTFVDEYLSNALCRYFFGAKADYIRLWKTKKFRNFNYYVVEGLSLMEKLRFLKSTGKVAKTIAADVERLNNLRNGIAHAFFPENLRSAKPMWKGHSIFTAVGIEVFTGDMDKLHSFFRKMKSTRP